MKANLTNAAEKQNTIPLTEAQIRVERWLSKIAPFFKDNPDATPRALFLPMEDLKALLKEHVDAKGVRVYYGVKLPKDGSVEPISEEVCGLLVPVLEDESGNRHDLLVNRQDEDDTYIYDFTTPCPVYCDKASKLFLPLPPESANGQ